MPRKHIFLKGYAYFITSKIKNNIQIFNNSECCNLLIKDFDYYRKNLDYLIYGYVIMYDHFHWIIHPSEKVAIPLIMKKIKGHSSFTINKYLNKNGSIWQADYYDHVIRNKYDFEEKVNYIHHNPVKEGLVKNMEDYKYSSYNFYFNGDESVLRVDIPRL